MVYIHYARACPGCEPWTKAMIAELQSRGVDHVVFSLDDGHVPDIGPDDILLCRVSNQCRQNAEFLSNALDTMRPGNVWPDRRSWYFWDNKIRQQKYFEERSIPAPVTRIITNTTDLSELSNVGLRFPLVRKESFGASSKYVTLIHSVKEVTSFPCLLQEFIGPEEKIQEIRIIGADGIYTGYEKIPRPGDWRGSGSGLHKLLDELPAECIDIADRVMRDNSLITACFDFLQTRSRGPLLVEMSYSWTWCSTRWCRCLLTRGRRNAPPLGRLVSEMVVQLLVDSVLRGTDDSPACRV